MAAKTSFIVLLFLLVSVSVGLADDRKFHACVEGAKLEYQGCSKECKGLTEEKSYMANCYEDCRTFLESNIAECKKNQ